MHYDDDYMLIALNTYTDEAYKKCFNNYVCLHYSFVCFIFILAVVMVISSHLAKLKQPSKLNTVLLLFLIIYFLFLSLPFVVLSAKNAL